MNRSTTVSLGDKLKSDSLAQASCTADRMPAHFKSTPSSVTTQHSVKAPLALPPSTSTPNITHSPSAVLVPGSPPQTPRATHDVPMVAAPPSRLATLRQNNLARKREQMKSMKMPELSEHSESDAAAREVSANSSKPADETSQPTAARRAGVPPQIAVTPFSSSCTMKISSGDCMAPPSPSDHPVTPSLPDSFLKQLGLSADDLENNSESVDTLPDKELESRFSSLALAFKTDRLTLDKRLGIQERSRDLAEQNIDKELQGLRDAIETLNQLCSDVHMKEIIAKIKHHLDVLEQSVARLSSRAEVFGAVQQEKRMCIAMDVMITHTENVRRLREKEQAEVEVARKVLSERSNNSTMSLDLGNIGERRSASLSVGPNGVRANSISTSQSPTPLTADKLDTLSTSHIRRRSEIALPHFFGGSGISPLTLNANMDSTVNAGYSQAATSKQFPQESVVEDPRQKFQTIAANLSVRNFAANTLRRASLDKQRKISIQSSLSSSSLQSLSRNSSTDPSQDADQVKKQQAQEEEAFRQGYEEGLKANVGRELNDLRDHQTTISHSLEQVRDHFDSLQKEEQHESDIDEAVSKVKDAIVQVRLWMSNPNWQSASLTLRRIAAGLIFLLAVIIVVFTFAPLVPSNISLRNHGQPAQ